MRKFYRNFFVGASCLVISVGGLAGCSEVNQTSSNDSKENKTKGTKKGGTTEISVMLFDRGNVPSGEGTIDNNRWTKWVNEHMEKEGVKVNYMIIPRSEEAQKIPVLMSSGSAADIMMTYNATMVQKYYTDGGTYELSPYLNEGVDNLKAYLGEDVIKQGQLASGEQYAIPARRATTAQNNLFIRKDWLDKLGMEIPTTVPEFYEALKAFKEQDPGGMGKENVVAYAPNGPIEDLIFLDHLDEKSLFINRSSYVYCDEGYKEYMQFRNRLYNEGLMDPEYFTDKGFGQRKKEQFVQGRLGAFSYDVSGNVDNLRGGLLQNLKKNIPEAEMISIIPLENVNDGKVYNPQYAITGGFNFIPKTAKDPQACIKYLDFLAGEGGFNIFHGFENEHYNLVDGVPVVKDAEYNAQTKDWIRHDLFLVGNQGYYKTEQDFIQATAKELPGWEQYVIDNYNNAMEGIRIPEFIYSSPTQTQQSANITKVNDDYSVRVTTCKPEEFDKLYEEWKTELERYEIQKIVEERTQYYSEMYE